MSNNVIDDKMQRIIDGIWAAIRAIQDTQAIILKRLEALEKPKKK